MDRIKKILLLMSRQKVCRSIKKGQHFCSQTLVASSIVESITAMMIVLISFGAGMSIYLNIMSNDQVLAKDRANSLLTHQLEQMLQQKKYIDQTFEINNLLIEQSIKRYTDHPQHYQCILRAYDPNDRLVHEIERIIYLPEAEQ